MSQSEIVILFGAGASHGAGYISPEAPPLAKDLYKALATHYPKEWGSLSQLGKWADKFSDDFERTMSDEVLPRLPPLCLLEWHRPVALFFAKYRLDGSRRDLYSKLMAELKARGQLERVTMGSLNYDCLLEQAMAELGLATDYMLDNAHPAGSIPLAKIHGSSNFVTMDMTMWRAHLTMPGSLVESSFDALPVHGLENALERKFNMYQPAFLPVLGMYAQDKPTFVAHAKLYRLRNMLGQMIIGAKALMLIGLRPTTDRDPHLWDPVARSTASKIGYIGGKDNYDTLKKMQASAVHFAESFEDGFTAVVNTLSS